jgi:hypothetical protein
MNDHTKQYRLQALDVLAEPETKQRHSIDAPMSRPNTFAA